MKGGFPIVGSSLSPRKGCDLWTKLRTTLNQVSKYYHCIFIDSVKIFGHHPLQMFIPPQTSLADVLAAFGAVPSGFRDSTLASLLCDSREGVWPQCPTTLLTCPPLQVT